MSIARPTAVTWSERLGLSGALLSGVRETLIWEQRVILDGEQLATLFTAGTPLLVGGLVLLVTRYRSRVALVIMFLLVALAWLTTAKLGLTDGSAAFTIGAASLLLSTAGLILMLLPTSRRWLRGPEDA